MVLELILPITEGNYSNESKKNTSIVELKKIGHRNIKIDKTLLLNTIINSLKFLLW